MKFEYPKVDNYLPAYIIYINWYIFNKRACRFYIELKHVMFDAVVLIANYVYF